MDVLKDLEILGEVGSSLDWVGGGQWGFNRARK